MTPDLEFSQSLKKVEGDVLPKEEKHKTRHCKYKLFFYLGVLAFFLFFLLLYLLNLNTCVKMDCSSPGLGIAMMGFLAIFILYIIIGLPLTIILCVINKYKKNKK